MKRLLTILYEITLALIAVVALPKLLYHLIVHKKYRNSLSVRLGIGYPSIQRKKTPLIWIHAVSVGETKAIATLARELKKRYPDVELVVSSTTETGHAEAKRSLAFAEKHVYLPFDFSFIVKPILSKASPDLVLLCESDLWYNFLRHAKKQGARIALVNGKMSHLSMKRFKWIEFFSKSLMNFFDVLCLQNDLYQHRFTEAAAPKQKMVVTGNLKLDEEYPRLIPEEVLKWKKKLGIELDQLILTIGSTHNPEEQIFINILKKVWKQFPNLKVLLVPRHPERFKEVAGLLHSNQISMISFTNIENATGAEKIILMDTMGMLRMCYQLSDIALVGGSYTSKVGGHNILEPCWYGKPVLFGPHMHTQLELVDLMKYYQAGIQTTEIGLETHLLQWIKNPLEREEIGQRGLHLVKEVKGSTKRTLSALQPILSVLER